MDHEKVTETQSPTEQYVARTRPIYVGSEVRVKLNRELREALKDKALPNENASKVVQRLLRDLLIVSAK